MGLGHRGLKLTLVNQVGGSTSDCGVRALQLQVAPGEQAALDGPEQGEQHRASLPVGPREHQQSTLKEADGENVHGKGRTQNTGMGILGQQMSLAKKELSVFQT